MIGLVLAALAACTPTVQPVTDVVDGSVSETTWWCLRDLGYRGVADGREALVNVPVVDLEACEQG